MTGISYVLLSILTDEYDADWCNINVFDRLPLHFKVFFAFLHEGAITEESFRVYINMQPIGDIMGICLDFKAEEDYGSMCKILSNINTSNINVEDVKSLLSGNSYSYTIGCILNAIFRDRNYGLFTDVINSYNSDVLIKLVTKNATKDIKFLDILFENSNKDTSLYDKFMTEAIILSSNHVAVIAEFISSKSETQLEIYYQKYGINDIPLNNYSSTQVFYTGFVDAGITVNFLREVYNVTKNPKLEHWLINNLVEDV